jgi:hypothetical protein
LASYAHGTTSRTADGLLALLALAQWQAARLDTVIQAATEPFLPSLDSRFQQLTRTAQVASAGVAGLLSVLADSITSAPGDDTRSQVADALASLVEAGQHAAGLQTDLGIES